MTEECFPIEGPWQRIAPDHHYHHDDSDGDGEDDDETYYHIHIHISNVNTPGTLMFTFQCLPSVAPD